MTLRLVQLRGSGGERLVAASDGRSARRVRDATTTYALANQAIVSNRSLTEIIESALHEGRILAPIEHPDTARMLLTGTGLTHLGSADARDKMHAKAHAADASDSMKMFRLGLESGKPGPGQGSRQ